MRAVANSNRLREWKDCLAGIIVYYTLFSFFFSFFHVSSSFSVGMRFFFSVLIVFDAQFFFLLHIAAVFALLLQQKNLQTKALLAAMLETKCF